MLSQIAASYGSAMYTRIKVIIVMCVACHILVTYWSKRLECTEKRMMRWVCNATMRDVPNRVGVEGQTLG